MARAHTPPVAASEHSTEASILCLEEGARTRGTIRHSGSSRWGRSAILWLASREKLSGSRSRDPRPASSIDFSTLQSRGFTARGRMVLPDSVQTDHAPGFVHRTSPDAWDACPNGVKTRKLLK